MSHVVHGQQAETGSFATKCYSPMSADTSGPSTNQS